MIREQTVAKAKPAVPKLFRVIVFVADTLKSAAFYQKHFGLKPVGPLTPEWAELKSGGLRLAFHQAFGKSGKIQKPTGSAWNPHKIVFYAKNVARERARLIRAGVKMGALHKFGELRFSDGKDAEGHAFQISNRP